MTMDRGKPTEIHGVFKTHDPSKWIVRLRWPKTEEEIRRVVRGTMANAVLAKEAVWRELEAKVGAKQSQHQETRPTLGDCAPLWFRALKTRKDPKQTFFDVRTRYLERFILPVFGHIAVADLRAKHLDKWMDWLVVQTQPETIGKRVNPHAGQRYARETLLSVWQTAKTLMSWSSMHVDCPNPWAGHVFNAKTLEEQAPKAKDALTRDEVAALMASFHGDDITPDMRVMVAVGLCTTSRFCEYSAFRWSDIDLVAGHARIHQSQTRGEVGPPKTEATRRWVRLPPEVVAMLVEHKQWLQMQGRNGGDLVFPSKTGGYRYPNVLRVPLRRALAAAGIKKHITAHRLRGTGVNLVRRAVGEVAARSIAGHSDPSMTHRYSTVDLDEKQAALTAAYGSALLGT